MSPKEQKLSITESPSPFNNLEKMTVLELLTNINNEDSKIHLAVAAVIPQISLLVNSIVERMKKGGRLFYLGAGTSGRLGVLDASELPPTFGESLEITSKASRKSSSSISYF